jgi:hypothetical protein
MMCPSVQTGMIYFILVGPPWGGVPQYVAQFVFIVYYVRQESVLKTSRKDKKSNGIMCSAACADAHCGSASHTR